MPYLASLPENATVTHIWQMKPERYGHLSKAWNDIMRGPSALSEGARELIAAYVSALNACHYCYGAHAAVAVEWGVAPDVLEGLIENVSEASVDDKLKPLLDYARKLTLEPAKLTQADADAVYTAGWPDDALHDAIAVCAMFNFMNRMVEGHGVDADDAVLRERAKSIHQMGYDGRHLRG